MQTFTMRTAYNRGVAKPAKLSRKSPKSVTIEYSNGALPVTVEQWQQYFSPNLEDNLGESTCVGIHQTVIAFRAPAVSIKFNGMGCIESYTLYGERQLQGCFPTGYNLEGVVSVKGKRKAHTSSVLCRLPDGKLLESAVIVCL